MWYQGRQYLVFRAKSHPYTYVWIFTDMHDSGKSVTWSFRRLTINPSQRAHI